MSDTMEQVREYLLDLGLNIRAEDAEEELFIVEDEDRGISNLVVDCEEPILIMEQMIMAVPEANQSAFYQRLLQMNRTLVHGAFVMNETATHIYFRDTLQLANLDFNELEGTIDALSLGLVEHGGELLEFARAEEGV